MVYQTAALSTGVTLAYALDGPDEAPVLCFVHGLGANLRQFAPQVEHFSREYRVLRLSLRGHGDSSTPPQPTPDNYTPRVLAQDVRALLAHLRVETTHFVGNSLGGLVGYELLKLGDRQLLSLTTFGTTAELHSSRLTYWTVIGSFRLLGIKGLAALVERTATEDRAVGQVLAQMYRSATKEALLLIARHIADYDYTSTVREARIPMLLIQCARDKEINAAQPSTLAALRQAPHGSVVALENAGHFANMEQPLVFNEILRGFLAQARGDG